MVAARLAGVAVHPLLDDDPAPVVGDDEAVQIEVEAVLHRGAVDLGDEAARGRERGAVEADPVADRDELMRGLARMRAASAADIEAEFACERIEPALQRPDDGGRDARRMPVHAHDGAERLEPERMGEPAQELVAAIFDDDRLSDDRAEPGHAHGQPARHAPAVQRQVGAAGTAGGHGAAPMCASALALAPMANGNGFANTNRLLPRSHGAPRGGSSRGRFSP